MITRVEQAGGMTMKVATYSSPADLAAHFKNRKTKTSRLQTDTEWAGGTEWEFDRGCLQGDRKYMLRADKYVEEFANLAIKDYDRTLDYNMQVGSLDYQAAYSGDPMCMYGSTIEEVDTAPIHIFVDVWTSCMIPAREMEMRGIAVLALTRALSVFRPVMLSVVTGCRHTPTRTDTLQVVSIPTAPMDTARASWMLGSPMFFRQGLLGMVWEISNSVAPCGIPKLSNERWQQHDLGNWLAAKQGIKEVVHLPFMAYSEDRWRSEASALAWVKKTVKKYAA